MCEINDWGLHQVPTSYKKQAWVCGWVHAKVHKRGARLLANLIQQLLSLTLIHHSVKMSFSQEDEERWRTEAENRSWQTPSEARERRDQERKKNQIRGSERRKTAKKTRTWLGTRSVQRERGHRWLFTSALLILMKLTGVAHGHTHEFKPV